MGNNCKEHTNRHLPKCDRKFQEHEIHFRQCTMNCRVSPLFTLTHSPPMTPYVSMRTLTLGEKVLRMKAAHPTMLPAIHTVRHPNLFVSALTTGPATYRLTLQLTLELTCVVASNCSRNHRISEKHKTVRSFKFTLPLQ